jgi:hypothetical protein
LSGSYLSYYLGCKVNLIFDNRAIKPTLKSFCTNLAHPFSANHAGYSDYNKRNAQQLSHIQSHASLKRFLNIFGELDKETERKYGGQAESEEESCAYFVLVLAVDV